MHDPVESCSFCDKTKKSVRILFAGPGVRICGECVARFVDTFSKSDWAPPPAERSRCSFCLQVMGDSARFARTGRFVVCHECVNVCHELIADADRVKDGEISKRIHSIVQEAEIHIAWKRAEEAEPLYLLALALLERQYPEDHPEVIACMERLGDTFVASNKDKDALPVYRRVLSILERNPGAAEVQANLREKVEQTLKRLKG